MHEWGNESDIFGYCGCCCTQSRTKLTPYLISAQDCFKNAPGILYDQLAAIFRGFLLHGHISPVLLLATLVPIVKDKLGNICSSDDYRSIAISSLILKIFDWVIILLYGDKLGLDELQFSYQPNISTNMCTWMAIETIDYFTRNASDVYVCTMDMSKAFDKVRHSLLFTKLVSKGLPEIYSHLLIVMRTKCHRTKCHPDKMSHRQNVTPTKCHTDKMSYRQNVIPTKCHPDKMSPGQNVTRTKCHPDKMSPWQNVTLTKCHPDKMSPWQNVTLTKCHPDKMSPWQNVTLTKCHTVKMSHRQNVTPSKCHTVKMSHRQNVTPSKCHTVKMSHRQNVTPSKCHRTKCHTDKMSHGQNVTWFHCHLPGSLSSR